MAVMGADPVELGAAAKQIALSRRRLDEAITRVASMLRSTGWSGPDAHAFRSQWQTRESSLRACSAALGEAAGELERHASEQVAASSATAGPSAPARVADLRARLPESTESFWVSSEVAALVGIDGEGRVTIEHMADGTALIWFGAGTGISLDGGIGGDVGSEQLSLGVGASAFARVATTERVGWRVADVDVGRFVALAAASEAVDRLSGDRLVPDALSVADIPVVGGWLAGRVGDRPLEPLVNPVGHLLDEWFDSTSFDVGEPHFRELHGALDLGGTAGGSALLGTLGTAAGMQWSVGARRGPDGAGIVLRGTAGARADAGTGSHAVHVTREVDMSLERDGPTYVTVTDTTRRGGHQEVELATYEVGQAERSEVLSAVRRGDLPAAAEALSGMVGGDRRPAGTARAEGVVDTRSVDDVGFSLAGGPKLDLALGGGRETVDYRG